MIDAARLRPGMDIVELAAGPGDTGFLAAGEILPGGRLLCTDAAEAMLDVARARAAELGIENAQFRCLNAESLDLPAAQLDAALCRWGFMLLADPCAALRETRRILRPGGRLALAAWDAPERNPWAWRATSVVVDQGLTEGRDSSAPGMFAWADPATIVHGLEDAGFADVEIDQVDLKLEYASFDAWWESTRALSAPFAALLDGIERRQAQALRAGIEDELAEFTATDGRLTMPARTHVAAAGA